MTVISILDRSYPRYREHARQDTRDLTYGQRQFMRRCALAYADSADKHMARALRQIGRDLGKTL